MKRKVKLFALTICLILMLPLLSNSNSIYGMENTDSISINGFSNEQIVDVYVENNELYVVTVDPLGITGKCPSSTKEVTKTYSRAELIKLHDKVKIEQYIREGLASFLASALSGSDFLIDAISPLVHSVSDDIERILFHSSQEKITVISTFTCTQKVQAGTWGHVWRLSSMKAK